MSHLRPTDRFVSAKNRTPGYEAAVAMLREMPEDDVDRAFAEAICERRGRHIVRDSSQGKITVKTYDLCINGLLGKSCPHRSDRWHEDPHTCAPPGSDHAVMLRRNGKAVSWLSQPYQLQWDDLEALVDFCRSNGLQAEIDAWGSWHFPGRTLLVAITKEAP